MATPLTLLRGLLPRTTAAGSSLVTTIEHAATPADVIDATVPLGSLERAFRSPHLGCVVVEDRAAGRLGLVTRARFHATVAGDLGYGRALLSRAQVADVVDWAPLVLDREVGVVEAALTMTSRTVDRRYDPVLVRADAWCVATPDDVVRALSALLAASLLRDDLTGLPNASHVELDIAERLARTAGTPHRVVLLVLRLEGLDRVRAGVGDAPADEIVRRAAGHVRAGAPAGWDVGRTADGELSLLGFLPGSVPQQAMAEYVDGLQRTLASTFPPVPAGETVVHLRSAAVLSQGRDDEPAELLTRARRRLGVPVPRQRPAAAG